MVRLLFLFLIVVLKYKHRQYYTLLPGFSPHNRFYLDCSRPMYSINKFIIFRWYFYSLKKFKKKISKLKFRRIIFINSMDKLEGSKMKWVYYIILVLTSQSFNAMFGSYSSVKHDIGEEFGFTEQFLGTSFMI